MTEAQIANLKCLSDAFAQVCGDRRLSRAEFVEVLKDFTETLTSQIEATEEELRAEKM